ncbi:MAG: hypothetical protein V1835_04285 [Candidatus Micrarchaeota archaeon]
MVFQRIRDFFFLRIIAPGLFRIDIPGYVIGRFSLLGLMNNYIFARNVFIPETFFENLEAEVIKKQGEEGKNALYRIGKQFGFRFAELYHTSRGDIPRSMAAITHFFETLYAEKIESSIDLNEKMLTLLTEDMAVTRKDGGGYCLTIGGCAGIWAYLIDDYTVECTIRKTSDRRYEFKSAPSPILAVKGSGDLIICNEKPKAHSFDAYKLHNSPPFKIPSSALNMQKLMQTELFTLNKSELDFAITDNRFVPVELFVLFEIERIFDEETVYRAAHDSFRDIGSKVKHQNPLMFISEILTAFGFGIADMLGEGNERIIIFHGYPWLDMQYEKTDFAVLKGAITGFLEGVTKRKYRIIQVQSGMAGNKFEVRVTVGGEN